MSATPLPGAPPAPGARDPEGDPFAWLRRPDALLRRFVLARIFEPPRARTPWRPRGAQAPVPPAPSPQVPSPQARSPQEPARSHHQRPADPDREGGR